MSRCILLADATRGCHSEEDAHFFIRAAAEAGVNGMLLPIAVAGPHYTQLKEEANALGILLLVLPEKAEHAQRLAELGMPLWQLGRAALDDTPLLKAAGASGAPVLLCAEDAPTDLLRQALVALHGAGSGPVTLLHGAPAFPAPPEEANLRAMIVLKGRFQEGVGYYDGTGYDVVPVMAAAMRADVVEFPLDRQSAQGMRDPDQLAAAVYTLRLAEQALGSGER